MAEHREPLLQTHDDADDDDDNHSLHHTQPQPQPQPLFQPHLFSHPLQQPDEPPPSYQPSKWSNSRPLLSFLGVNDEDQQQQPEDPFADLSEGPRTVFINRSDDGFGFTIGGSQPVHVVDITNDGPAHSKGLKAGDQILEINGIDVMQSDLAQASTHIQEAESTLTMIVIPKSPNSNTNESPWQAAIRALERGNGQQGSNIVDIAIDPTQRPPDNLRASVCSFFCCPLVGAGAIYHSIQVHRAWATGAFTRARMHALMSKKLSGSAIVYGFIFILFIIFVQLGKTQEEDPF